MAGIDDLYLKLEQAARAEAARQVFDRLGDSERSWWFAPLDEALELTPCPHIPGCGCWSDERSEAAEQHPQWREYLRRLEQIMSRQREILRRAPVRGLDAERI